MCSNDVAYVHNVLKTLLSTGWFQEQIQAWLHNRSKIDWAPYGRSTKCQISPSLNIVKTEPKF